MNNEEAIKEIKRIYDERARNSDSIEAAGQWGPKEHVPEICEKIIYKIGIRPTDKVLEVACGSCVLGNVVKEKCELYLGFDISSLMLRRGYEDGASDDRLNLVQASANKFPFKDNFFDVVIMNSVTMYFPDSEFLKKVLAEIERVSNHSSTIFIGENTNPTDYYNELVWFQDLPSIMKTLTKSYIRFRRWIASKSSKLAGKWKYSYRDLSPKFIKKYFQGRGDVIVTDAAVYTVRKMAYGDKFRGSRRIDILIKLGRCDN